ncbi:MAG TPA: Ig-like domain-containing protein [Candidatus Angelobacter sp.]
MVLPDTQNEAQFAPTMMNSQTKWVVDNAKARNIQMVLGVGDIVNDGASDAQQQNADAAIRLLDNAGIPYQLAIGNHDYDGANPKSRSVVGFNHWFGPARYAGKAFYKGNFPSGSNENFFGELTIGGKTYLFLMLEFRPRSSSLDWAESILSANPDKETIVVVHSFLRTNSMREDVCDTQDMPAGNANGQQMWTRLRKHANVIMVLNGHFTGGTVAHRSDVGDNSNLVNQIYANFQDRNHGEGWLEIITFHPVTNSISVQTFSPFLNQSMTGAAQQFTVAYHNPHPNTGIGSMGGKVRNPSTCAAISGVTVKAGTASAVTATDGTYKFSLAPGSYSVTASKSGVNSSTLPETISDSRTTQLDFYLTASSSAPCKLNTASPSVTICTPANNATVTSPVRVIAGTTDSRTVSFVQAYVDGKAVVTQTGNKLNASITMARGTHRLTVQAKDSAGVIFKQTINITVQ